MRRHQQLIPLSREHHSMLLLAQLLKKDAPAYKGLPTEAGEKCTYAQKNFHELINPHFSKEEDILFVLCQEESSEFDQWVETLKQEHQNLRALFEKLDPRQPDVAVMNELGFALEAHIRKEERQFFQELQNTLGSTLDHWQLG